MDSHHEPENIPGADKFEYIPDVPINGSPIHSEMDAVVVDEWADGRRSIDLCNNEYPDPEQFVSGFLTIGLTILSATPKAGKSWLIHEFAIGACCGKNALGILPCLQTEVLCLFLEDSERRVVIRERKLLGNNGGCGGLTYFFANSIWSPAKLERYLDRNPRYRVVIIDTAERFKQSMAFVKTGGVYSDDYAFWGALQALAMRRDIAIIVLHHDKKPNGSNGGNILDTVSGTRAITGSADHIWLLDRDRDSGISTLSIVGRDLEESSIQFTRGNDGKLRAIGQTISQEEKRKRDIRRSRELRKSGKTCQEIADELGISKNTAYRWTEDDKYS
jgi:AAA domain/Homeodomain-like domain